MENLTKEDKIFFAKLETEDNLNIIWITAQDIKMYLVMTHLQQFILAKNLHLFPKQK